MKNILYGTVQGSILGPVLFVLFTSPMEDLVGLLITYADDNYSLGADKNEANSVSKCVEQASIMVKWLTESGLCINTGKTEICVFSKKHCAIDAINLSGHSIPVKKQMKVLGIVFDQKLTWYPQVEKAVQSANKAKQGLSLIARYFTPEEMIKLATSFFIVGCIMAQKCG